MNQNDAPKAWLGNDATKKLFLAINEGDADLEAVRLLLDGGADLNACDYDGSTALLCAAGNNWTPLETLCLLLDRGADPNACDHDGGTALFYAARDPWTRLDTLRLLLDRGTDPNACDYAGRTALAVAEESGHTKTAALLRAALESRDLAAALPPAHNQTTRVFEDLGAPDPQPARSNRPRL